MGSGFCISHSSHGGGSGTLKGSIEEMRQSKSSDGVELLLISQEQMDPQAPDVEIQAGRRSEFKNLDIENLSWKDLTVTVTDRKTKKPK